MRETYIGVPEANALLKVMNYISYIWCRCFALSYNFTELFPLEKYGRTLKFSGVVGLNARNLFRGTGGRIPPELTHF